MIQRTIQVAALILLGAALARSQVPVRVTNDGFLNYQPSLIQRESGDLGWRTQNLVNPTVCQEPDGSLTMTYDCLSNGGYVTHSSDGGVSWDHDRTNVSSGSLNRIMRHTDGTYILGYQRRTGTNY